MKWLRPSGTYIELLDSENMTRLALSLGWKESKPAPKKQPKKDKKAE